jgi:glycosyltransferase involved in cell wall biosynthesis
MAYKILCVSHSGDWGGAEKCLFTLLKEIDRQSFEPVVVLPWRGVLGERISALGIQTHIVDLDWCLTTQPDDLSQRIRWGEGLRKRSTAIATLIEREDVDLVFTNSLAVMDGAIAAGLAGVPHVWHVLELLGLDPDLHPRLSLEAFHSLVDVLCDRIITVSDSVKKNIEGYCQSNKITTVFTGIDVPEAGAPLALKEHLGLEHDGPIVCLVGGISKRKGALTLAEAAPEILRALPNTQFLVVGADGGAEADMRAAVVDKGVSANFRFLGFRDDSLDIIANSQLLVLPSVADPLPLVVLEAMLLGKPVVATHSGGASEMVVEGVTGALVPVNDPSALAFAITQILKDPRQALRMGEEGKERARNTFSLKSYVDNIEAVFGQVLSQSGPNPLRFGMVETLVGVFESAVVTERKLLEQERKAREFDLLVGRIRGNPVFEAYHWVKQLGRER